MKQFNDIVVLTSKNPEAFCNFTYDGDDRWILQLYKEYAFKAICTGYQFQLDLKNLLQRARNKRRKIFS